MAKNSIDNRNTSAFLFTQKNKPLKGGKHYIYRERYRFHLPRIKNQFVPIISWALWHVIKYVTKTPYS